MPEEGRCGRGLVFCPKEKQEQKACVSHASRPDTQGEQLKMLPLVRLGNARQDATSASALPSNIPCSVYPLWMPHASADIVHPSKSRKAQNATCATCSKTRLGKASTKHASYVSPHFVRRPCWSTNTPSAGKMQVSLPVGENQSIKRGAGIQKHARDMISYLLRPDRGLQAPTCRRVCVCLQQAEAPPIGPFQLPRGF